MTDKLIEQLRDEESYYRWQEKHWCVDFDLLERLHLEAANRIEDLEAQLKTVLDREAETHRRHDAKIEAQAAEIERLEREVQKQRSLRDQYRAAWEAEKARAALGEAE
jgi:predicted RNase H-like nuclease (RuvC/YqgF family)